MPEWPDSLTLVPGEAGRTDPVHRPRVGWDADGVCVRSAGTVCAIALRALPRKRRQSAGDAAIRCARYAAPIRAPGVKRAYGSGPVTTRAARLG